jgi:hypothetical protein
MSFGEVRLDAKVSFSTVSGDDYDNTLSSFGALSTADLDRTLASDEHSNLITRSLG